MKFVRWGNLNLVNQRKAFKEEGFHKPPSRKGIYVFHPDFIELFLIAWKFDKPDLKFKKFNYEGKIWTHMFYNHPEITYYRKSKEWYLTDTKSVKKILALEINKLNKSSNKDLINNWGVGWKKDAWKWFTKDHFEFFIDKKI